MKPSVRARYARELSALTALIVLLIGVAVGAPSFFGASNLIDTLLSNAPVAIAAIGMLLVIVCGHIDISVASQFAIVSVASGVLAREGLPMPAVAVACIAIGALLGSINGVLVAFLHVPSIVATLATMIALREGLRMATQGEWISQLPAAFQWFGLSQAAGQVAIFAATGLLYVAFSWALRNVAAGRAVYATGSDPESTRLAGIDPQRVVLWVFIANGALVGLAAVLNSVRFNAIQSNAGTGLEMKVIAAVVVGGASITGGRGTIIGTLIGVVLLGIVGTALTFLGVSAYWEKAIQGGIVLAAVLADPARIGRRTHARVAAA
jgi:rhamnose transport system permease protein